MQVREDDASDLKRGTRITLHLKQDAKDLADAQKLGALIKQYSEFIQFPIKLWASKTEYDQVRSSCITANVQHICPADAACVLLHVRSFASQQAYQKHCCCPIWCLSASASQYVG